jgi:hypothetical protein
MVSYSLSAVLSLVFGTIKGALGFYGVIRAEKSRFT